MLFDEHERFDVIVYNVAGIVFVCILEYSPQLLVCGSNAAKKQNQNKNQLQIRINYI